MHCIAHTVMHGGFWFCRVLPPDFACGDCYLLDMQMELRYNEIDRARNIYERYVQCIPSVKAWVRYANFDLKIGQVCLARQCYASAVGEMGEDAQTVSCAAASTFCSSDLALHALVRLHAT